MARVAPAAGPAGFTSLPARRPTGGASDRREIEQVLTEADIELRELGSGSSLPGRIHSKYLLVDGATGQESAGRLVLTGSHNYTHTSLYRNDETLLELRSKAVYEQYEDNFETMWDAAGAAEVVLR
ncbi:phospholipase D family protein [Georgenia sp. SUBG003]|uniref:phospholipase D family protein n=1 Tax=Georgenia sp. SUBG003 TaxID=1497974 RepID=UPI003AB6FB9B